MPTKKQDQLDGLTRLYDRQWLEDTLPRFVKRHSRSGQPLTILLADIDHFKCFNDSYGFFAGDRVLVGVAQTLKQSVRPSDLVARYGGEEFLVILPDTDVAGARSIAEELRVAVSEASLTTANGAQLPKVRISIGGAQLSGAQTTKALILAADEALYRSKYNGRNLATFAYI